MSEDDPRVQGIIITTKGITYFPWLMEKDFASYVKSGEYEENPILDSMWLAEPTYIKTIRITASKIYDECMSRISSD